MIIYSNRNSDTFRTSVLEIATDCTLVGMADLDNTPELLQQVEIWYGHISHDQLNVCTKLKWVQHQGAGVEALPLHTYSNRGITLTNASGVHAEPITEHMFGMLLMLTRCLDVARKDSDDAAWNKRNPSANVTELFGKTLGLLGVGAIGTKSAEVGRAFGMQTIGLRRTAVHSAALDRSYTLDNRDEFFSKSDVIMNTLPATKETVNFISHHEISLMKPGVIIVNTGRGSTIDTDALIDGLNSGQVGAALLDVTNPEPLPDGHPLWSAPNVFITPHYSGSHPTYDARADAIFLTNLEKYIRGTPLDNAVDTSTGY